MRELTVIMTALLSLAGATLAATSAGQTPTAAALSGASNSAAAVRHYEEGVKAAKSARWNSAYEEFLAAWKLKQHYQIAANLGRAELKLGKYRDAAEHLAYFLREAPHVDEAERAAAQAMLDEARAKVVALTILVDRAGAEVLVDGVAIGKAPLGQEVFVEPGRRTVEARLGGLENDRKALDIGPGSTRRVLLTLVPRAGEKDESPARPIAVAPVGPRVPAAPEQTPPGGLSMQLIGAGITASTLAAAAGVALTFVSLSRADAREDACGTGPYATCDEMVWRSFEDERALTANAAIASFIGAGVVAAATVSYVIHGSSSKPEGASGIAVRIHPHGGGASVSATW